MQVVVKDKSRICGCMWVKSVLYVGVLGYSLYTSSVLFRVTLLLCGLSFVFSKAQLKRRNFHVPNLMFMSKIPNSN